MWQACSSVFPSTSLHGCFFHWCQAIWRHVQKCNLQNQYRNNNVTRIRISTSSVCLSCRLIILPRCSSTFTVLQTQVSQDSCTLMLMTHGCKVDQQPEVATRDLWSTQAKGQQTLVEKENLFPPVGAIVDSSLQRLETVPFRVIPHPFFLKTTVNQSGSRHYQAKKPN